MFPVVLKDMSNAFYLIIVHVAIVLKVPPGKTIHELMHILYEEMDKMESSRRVSTCTVFLIIV